MIMTGCLQRWAYKMVTSPASLFDQPRQPDVLLRSLSNCCKVWRPESYIFHPAYCVLSFDMGSRFTFASDYRNALIRQEPALLQDEWVSWREDSAHVLGRLQPVQEPWMSSACSVLKSFRHLQLMINCEWWEIKSSKASCLPWSAKWL